MKWLFILLSSLITLHGCRSSGKKVVRTETVSLAGKWKYLKSEGGFTGKGAGYPPETFLVFKKDSTYFRQENDAEVNKGEYRTGRGRSIYSEDEKDMIFYTGALPQSYQISGDTLFLSDEVHDGYQFIYLRSK